MKEEKRRLWKNIIMINMALLSPLATKAYVENIADIQPAFVAAM
jgi:hypothetical protein